MGRERLRRQLKSDFLGTFKLYLTHWNNAGLRKRCCYYIIWGNSTSHPESQRPGLHLVVWFQRSHPRKVYLSTS